MRRADVLGIMAAQLWISIDSDEDGDGQVQKVVWVADELLREAEKISPPEAVPEPEGETTE